MPSPEGRADALIARLGLAPHPEGGWYRRLYRSTATVNGAGGERPAVTSIVYLLRGGEVSRWHRVRADELWHFYEGAPLMLTRADPELEQVEDLLLAPVDRGLPLAAVAAHHWQAARCSGDYSLVGCSVAPGFDFADFALLADDAGLSERLRARHPAYVALL